MNENEISKIVVAAAVEAHRTLGGSGLLERVYEEALAHELAGRGVCVERQKKFQFVTKARCWQHRSG